MSTDTSYKKTRKPDECALITELWARQLAYPLALAAQRMGLTANAVTLLAGGCWLASVPLMVWAGWCFRQQSSAWGWGCLLVCGLLWNLGYILDLADGSLARLTGTACPSGFFLDYVFHLLFKPMFLLSIGVFLFLVHGSIGLLILAVGSVCSNWTAASASSEHVACQLVGQGRLDPASLSHEGRQRIFLGDTDIQNTVEAKQRSVLQTIRVLTQEILSYYGQFTFFSVLVLVDGIVAWMWRPCFPALTIAFTGLSLAMLIRVPFRVRREFRRIRPLDSRCEAGHGKGRGNSSNDAESRQ